MQCSVISLYPVAILLHLHSVQLCIRMNQVERFFLRCLAIFPSISFALCIVGGRNAAVPPFDDPVVFVNHVGRFSRVEGYQNPSTGLYTFRGIKYADPPVRENRFLRPRSKRLSGDVDARRNAPPVPSPITMVSIDFNFIRIV